MSIPWWTPGDTNAFFGLGFNILVNVLTLTGLMIGVVKVPAGDVLGTVLPALGVALILGNVYYTFLARRLARRDDRTDVTALPYGPSVPHMFIVVFVVMLPVYLKTKDPMQAWQAGLAWAFMIGIIVMIGAFVGPYIRKLTPRAAMLGTLAGISITFISMRPAAQMWEAAWIGLPVLAIILIGFFTDVKLPFGIPVGLAALLVGTAIGWIGGYMSAPDVGQAHLRHRDRRPRPPRRPAVLRAGAPGAAAGHRHPAGRLQLHRGHEQRGERRGRRRRLQPAQRAARRRRRRLSSARRSARRSRPRSTSATRAGRTPAAGPATRSPAAWSIGILCFLGLFGVLDALLPVPAIVPILLYIGLLIGAQAFQAVPRLHAVAVVAAHPAEPRAMGQRTDRQRAERGGHVRVKVGMDALNGAGVVYQGLQTLGEGAVLVGLVLGTMVTFILEKKFLYAAIASAVGAVLSFIGLIHAPQVHWAATRVALGYLFFGVVCLAY